MNAITIRAPQRRLLAAGLLLIGIAAVGTRCSATVIVRADPVATCHSRFADGIEEDVCFGNPASPGGVNRPDLYPGVVPELYFGLGLGFGS
ncbi:MAG: hypothetical protein P4L86_07480 [Mycobacterium sp.]|nr:hypothetical protein [Mycobacterium sp.]